MSYEIKLTLYVNNYKKQTGYIEVLVVDFIEHD